MRARLEGYRQGRAYVSSDAELAATARARPVRIGVADSEGRSFESIELAN